MCRFIETIAVLNGKVQNLEYHLARYNRTCKAHWKGAPSNHFKEKVLNAINDSRGLWKLRVVYGEKTMECSFAPYQKRQIDRLVPVFSETIEYPYKSEDRTELNSLKKGIENNEEILIVKNGLITDTSFTNVVLYNGNEYITPEYPLLPGTQMQKLLESGRIIKAPVYFSDLKNYREIHLINAFLDLGDLCIAL